MSSHNHESAWSAPFAPSRPLAATLLIPGSKSIMARALILAALSDAPTLIKRPLISRDSELMRDGLRALGVKIEESPDAWRVVPHPRMAQPKNRVSADIAGTDVVRIDVGNAGTVMRFLPPVAALSLGTFRFDGDIRSHERPLAPVIKALEDLGVSVEHEGRYSLPMTIHGSGHLAGGTVEVDASLSSQFVSSLLLAGSAMENGLVIKDIGESLPSMPHIEMTIAMLRAQGIEVESGIETGIDNGVRDKHWWRVAPRKTSNAALDQTRVEPNVHQENSFQETANHTIEIEPDLSNAAPFLAAALLVGGEVAIKNWPLTTTQPGDALRKIFTMMGANFRREGDDLVIEASGKRSDIKGIDIDLSDEGELTPTIAAVTAFASSPSHLRGIGHLRLHETDRLAALAIELRKVGATVVEGESDLKITPADQLPSGPITIETYDDHRIATLGALVGLMIPGTLVENIATTRKTITDFPALWQELLGSSRATPGATTHSPIETPGTDA